MTFALVLRRRTNSAVGTVLAATNWTCAARAIWTLVEVEPLLLAAPAVQLRTARTGRSLVGLDGSETADALLRLLAAGHHGTDGKPTAAGTTASFDPRSAISGADLRLGPGGLGRLAQGPMVGLSTERNERNTICLFWGGHDLTHSTRSESSRVSPISTQDNDRSKKP